MRVHGVVEKPAAEHATSNLAVIGRYVLPTEIFDAIDRTEPGFGGEIQLTDAIDLLLGEEPVHGVVFSEGRYDAGDKLDFLRANIELALDRPDLGPGLAAILADIARRRPA
jgi:UTP--glucose-1-phosphate uridylyltransferase